MSLTVRVSGSQHTQTPWWLACVSCLCQEEPIRYNRVLWATQLPCDIVDGPVSLTDSLWYCCWMASERRKGGKRRRHRKKSDGCHPSLGCEEWVIPTYLSPGEREGWMSGGKNHAHTARHISSWLVHPHPVRVRLRGTPYFVDCPFDKIKSSEARGDILSCPWTNHKADSRRKSYTHGSWQCCFDGVAYTQASCQNNGEWRIRLSFPNVPSAFCSLALTHTRNVC